MEFKSIAILADQHSSAQEAYKKLQVLYKNVPPEEADIIIALGGDGFMLTAIHEFMEKSIPITNQVFSSRWVTLTFLSATAIICLLFKN